MGGAPCINRMQGAPQLFHVKLKRPALQADR